MKKKLLSLAMAALMTVSASAIAMAEENSPEVCLDGTPIVFYDQAAVIKEGRTLIPARGVFEAMQAKVEWNDADRTVTVTDKNNVIYITLEIDNPVMKVRTYTSLQNADVNEVTLDVPPQILSDRTMVPLRAISEALNAQVEWNEAAYRVDITTADKPAENAVLPTLSLSASKTTAAAGEDFDILVNVSNVVENKWVAAVSAAIEYSRDDFEFVDAVLLANDGSDTEEQVTVNDENTDAMHIVALTINENLAVTSDAPVVKLTFRAKTGNAGSFTLKKGYNTFFGFSNAIALVGKTDPENPGKFSPVQYDGNSLKVDSTPVSIN